MAETEPKESAPKPAPARPPAPRFSVLMERHRRGGALHARLATLLIGVGAIAALWGAGGGPNWTLVGFGAFAIALSAIPLWQRRSIGERIAGLEVLRDEWADMERDPNTPEIDFHRLRGLIERLYAKT